MATRDRYGKVDKFLHWWVVLNLGATLIASRGMADLPMPERVVEYGDHGLSVTTLLIAMILRVAWRYTHPAPALPDTMRGWEKASAHLVHYGLYWLIFIQIGIGILMASTTKADFVARGYGINYTDFGLVPASAHDWLLWAHDTVYWGIVAFIAVHVGAALKHEFIDKDNVLRRMLPFARQRG
jgi:cytochrome b561